MKNYENRGAYRLLSPLGVRLNRATVAALFSLTHCSSSKGPPGAGISDAGGDALALDSTGPFSGSAKDPAIEPALVQPLEAACNKLLQAGCIGLGSTPDEKRTACLQVLDLQVKEIAQEASFSGGTPDRVGTAQRIASCISDATSCRDMNSCAF